jgi:phenylpropionate dioxygenase-like ring-hydroxylating dioxygenase large terminal subunit
MLSVEDNEALCRVGPETLMGDMFRQYWLPAATSAELPSPDCPPLRVRLLAEDLIAFRTTSGAVGMMQNACPHRGASMFFGRNEEEGLRCVYHGWKFDTTGACVDMPSEPAESNFKTKVRAKSYPCIDRNGVIWCYMGPETVPPPLPELEGNMIADCQVTVLYRANNWMQGIEGELDTIHAAFLHGGANQARSFEPGTFGYYQSRSRDGKFSVRDTDYGTSYGMYREAEEDSYYWRIGHLLFPCYAMPPGASTLGNDARFLAYVPMDDYNTLEWSVGRRDPAIAAQGQFGREYLPNGTGWLARFRIEQNQANDYKIDREAQSAWKSYTGIAGIRQQDMAMTESMGKVMDRTREHLGTTDQMIIQTRRRYLAAAKALRDQGTAPPGARLPHSYHQRSGQVVIPRNVDWWEATRDLRERFEAQGEASVKVEAS